MGFWASFFGLLCGLGAAGGIGYGVYVAVVSSQVVKSTKPPTVPDTSAMKHCTAALGENRCGCSTDGAIIHANTSSSWIGFLPAYELSARALQAMLVDVQGFEVYKECNLELACCKKLYPLVGSYGHYFVVALPILASSYQERPNIGLAISKFHCSKPPLYGLPTGTYHPRFSEDHYQVALSISGPSAYDNHYYLDTSQVIGHVDDLSPITASLRANWVPGNPRQLYVTTRHSTLALLKSGNLLCRPQQLELEQKTALKNLAHKLNILRKGSISLSGKLISDPSQMAVRMIAAIIGSAPKEIHKGIVCGACADVKLPRRYWTTLVGGTYWLFDTTFGSVEAAAGSHYETMKTPAVMAWQQRGSYCCMPGHSEYHTVLGKYADHEIFTLYPNNELTTQLTDNSKTRWFTLNHIHGRPFGLQKACAWHIYPIVDKAGAVNTCPSCLSPFSDPEDPLHELNPVPPELSEGVKKLLTPYLNTTSFLGVNFQQNTQVASQRVTCLTTVRIKVGGQKALALYGVQGIFFNRLCSRRFDLDKPKTERSPSAKLGKLLTPSDWFEVDDNSSKSQPYGFLSSNGDPLEVCGRVCSPSETTSSEGGDEVHIVRVHPRCPPNSLLRLTNHGAYLVLAVGEMRAKYVDFKFVDICYRGSHFCVSKIAGVGPSNAKALAKLDFAKELGLDVSKLDLNCVLHAPEVGCALKMWIELPLPDYKSSLWMPPLTRQTAENYYQLGMMADFARATHDMKMVTGACFLDCLKYLGHPSLEVESFGEYLLNTKSRNKQEWYQGWFTAHEIGAWLSTKGWSLVTLGEFEGDINVTINDVVMGEYPTLVLHNKPAQLHWCQPEVVDALPPEEWAAQRAALIEAHRLDLLANRDDLHRSCHSSSSSQRPSSRSSEIISISETSEYISSYDEDSDGECVPSYYKRSTERRFISKGQAIAIAETREARRRAREVVGPVEQPSMADYSLPDPLPFKAIEYDELPFALKFLRKAPQEGVPFVSARYTVDILDLFGDMNIKYHPFKGDPDGAIFLEVPTEPQDVTSFMTRYNIYRQRYPHGTIAWSRGRLWVFCDYETA